MATYIDGRVKILLYVFTLQKLARGRHSVVPKSMRVLSHPRVRSPLGFAASTWFFQNRSFATDRTRFHPSSAQRSGPGVTVPTAGRGDLRPRWSAAPQSR